MSVGSDHFFTSRLEIRFNVQRVGKSIEGRLENTEHNNARFSCRNLVEAAEKRITIRDGKHLCSLAGSGGRIKDVRGLPNPNRAPPQRVSYQTLSKFIDDISVNIR